MMDGEESEQGILAISDRKLLLRVWVGVVLGEERSRGRFDDRMSSANFRHDIPTSWGGGDLLVFVWNQPEGGNPGNE